MKEKPKRCKKEIYTSFWKLPRRKWKVGEVVVVEDGKIITSLIGGIFFGDARPCEKEWKEAILDFVFYDPRKFRDKEEWRKELKKLRKEVEVKFVDEKKLEEIKSKCFYPDEETEESEEELPPVDEETLNYIG